MTWQVDVATSWHKAVQRLAAHHRRLAAKTMHHLTKRGML
jgi:hypothetical protein